MSKWRNIAVCSALLIVLLFAVFHQSTRFSANFGMISPIVEDDLSDKEEIDLRSQSSLDSKLQTGGIQQLQRGGEFRRRNRGIAQYSETVEKRMADTFKLKLKAMDPDLVQLVRDIIDPPSDSETVKLSYPIKPTPQSTEIESVLNKRVCSTIIYKYLSVYL